MAIDGKFFLDHHGNKCFGRNPDHDDRLIDGPGVGLWKKGPLSISLGYFHYGCPAPSVFIDVY